MWCGGGLLLVVWCNGGWGGCAVVVVVLCGFRNFTLLCQSAQLCNRNLPSEALDSQCGLASLSSGQAASLPELSGSLLL